MGTLLNFSFRSAKDKLLNLAPKKLIQIGKIYDVTLLAIDMQSEIELLHFGIRYLKAFVDFLTPE